MKRRVERTATTDRRRTEMVLFRVRKINPKLKWSFKVLGTQDGKPFLIHVERRMKFDISLSFTVR